MTKNTTDKIFNAPALRFPEFKGEWEKCKLGDIASLSKGNGISKDQLTLHGEPCILYGELYTKYKSERISDVFSKTDLSDSNLVRSRKNDVIIPSSGETAEDIAIARCVLKDNILLGGDLNIIRLKEDDGSFMSYQLNGKRKFDIAKVAQGVSIVHLYGDSLKDLYVYRPTIQEQKKIVLLLSTIDERIETQNKVIENLKSLIKELTDNLIIGLLGSETHPFSTLYKKAGEGGTPVTSIDAYYKNGTIPFIKIEDLSSKYLTHNKDFITELGMQKSSAWLIPARSVIYSNGATIGAISINKYPVCTKQGILGIVPNDNITVEFLYLLMSSSYFSNEVRKIVTEGTMKTAYLKDINHIKCPVPTISLQQKMTNLTSALTVKLINEQNILKFFEQQKQYLLRKMFI